MPHIQLTRVVGIDPFVLSVLQRNNFHTVKDVLLLNVVDLIELLNITHSQALALIQAVSAHVCPAYQTAHELHQQHHVGSGLWTTLPTLDHALRRGLPPGNIIELVGPAGVGKSQMCFMMSLLTAAPLECGGLGAAVMYLDIEKRFSPGRFVEMARARFPGLLSGGPALDSTLSRVLLMSPASSADLMSCLMGLEVGIIEHGARLVVLDSIAALARSEFSGSTGGGPPADGGRQAIIDRQAMLGQVAARLKYLGQSLNVPVLVTNQVTTRIQPGPRDIVGQQQQQQQPGGYLTAALGTVWAHCVNVRLVQERVGERRFLKVAKSPSSDMVSLEYVITARGVEEVQGAVLPGSTGQRSVLNMAIANEVDFGMAV